MEIEKLKTNLESITASCVVTFKKFTSSLNDFTKTLDAENELAKFSNWTFVDAFRPIAKALSEFLPRSYISFVNEAIDMVKNWDDPVDVLWFFDMKLDRTKRRNTMSRYLRKEENLNISEKALGIYSNSSFSFYRDGDEYYYHDISNASKQPIENFTYIGSIEDVEEFLLAMVEEE